jgi:hypothetical protein
MTYFFEESVRRVPDVDGPAALTRQSPPLLNDFADGPTRSTARP